MVLKGRADEWRQYQVENQGEFHQPPQPQAVPIQRPQPSAAARPQRPQSIITSRDAQIQQQQQQHPKKLPELLYLIGEKRTKPTGVQPVNIQYLENCYKNSKPSERIHVWNCLLPLLANSKITIKDLISLQYLAVQMELELIKAVKGIDFSSTKKIQSVNELDFDSQIESYELLQDFNAHLEQLVMIFYCFTSVNNFALFFSKRPRLIAALERLLLYKTLTIESWERVLEGFELIQRFSKNLDEQNFLRSFCELLTEDLSHSIGLVASKACLSLQLGDLNDNAQEVSSFPWIILPRRTFFCLSILFNHHDALPAEELVQCLEKLLSLTYYKIARQVNFKVQKIPHHHTIQIVNGIATASIEDFGYTELALLILAKLRSPRNLEIYWGLFKIVWGFFFAFSGVNIPKNFSLDALSFSHNQSSILKILKLLSQLVSLSATVYTEEIIQKKLDLLGLPRNSLAHLVLDPIISDLYCNAFTKSFPSAPDLNFDFHEVNRMESLLLEIKRNSPDWVEFFESHVK